MLETGFPFWEMKHTNLAKPLPWHMIPYPVAADAIETEKGTLYKEYEASTRRDALFAGGWADI